MPIRLKFSKHAQDRIQERQLQAEHIRLAIRNPDFTRKIFDSKVKVSKKMEDGRAITVIFYKEDFRGTNNYFIITAYYT